MKFIKIHNNKNVIIVNINVDGDIIIFTYLNEGYSIGTTFLNIINVNIKNIIIANVPNINKFNISSI